MFKFIDQSLCLWFPSWEKSDWVGHRTGLAWQIQEIQPPQDVDEFKKTPSEGMAPLEEQTSVNFTSGEVWRFLNTVQYWDSPARFNRGRKWYQSIAVPLSEFRSSLFLFIFQLLSVRHKTVIHYLIGIT
jgi:hypothetical protein